MIWQVPAAAGFLKWLYIVTSFKLIIIADAEFL
jgi:hypothetical protein